MDKISDVPVIQATLNFVPEMLHSGGYSFQSAYNGAAQLVGLPECKLLSEHKGATGSDWVAQQIGSGVSVACQFWLLERGLKGGTVAPSFGRKLAISGAAGALYGGVFTPVDPADHRPAWLARTENAAILGTSLPLMGLAGRGFQGLGRSLEASAMTGYSRTLINPVGKFLSTEIGSGIASGVPGGLWYTTGRSLAECRIPTFNETTNNLVNFSIVGGLLGARPMR